MSQSIVFRHCEAHPISGLPEIGTINARVGQARLACAEAIQSPRTALDCFASLAMTARPA